MASSRRAAHDAVYLDCDPGIDDALAIAVMLRHRPGSLRGIGTVSGNVDAVVAARNAAGILALADRRDIPVAIGRLDPLSGQYKGGFAEVHGSDGLGEVEVPQVQPCYSDDSAIFMLLRLAREYRGRLQVIAVGPLTNIAAALELEPKLPEMIEELVIMGGAYAVAGNVTPHAEANIWSDPEAADRVLRSGMRVTLVPLDVTMKHTLTADDFSALKGSPDALARSVGRMLEYYAERYSGQFEELAAPLHDPLAVGIALGLINVVEETAAALRVELAGDRRGALATMSDSGAPTVRVVLQVDQAAAARLRDAVMNIEVMHRA